MPQAHVLIYRYPVCAGGAINQNRGPGTIVILRFPDFPHGAASSCSDIDYLVCAGGAINQNRGPGTIIILRFPHGAASSCSDISISGVRRWCH